MMELMGGTIFKGQVNLAGNSQLPGLLQEDPGP